MSHTIALAACLVENATDALSLLKRLEQQRGDAVRTLARVVGWASDSCSPDEYAAFRSELGIGIETADALVDLHRRLVTSAARPLAEAAE